MLNHVFLYLFLLITIFVFIALENDANGKKPSQLATIGKAVAISFLILVLFLLSLYDQTLFNAAVIVIITFGLIS